MIKGNISKVSHGSFNEIAKAEHTAFAKNINTNASGKIYETSKEGVVYGEPAKREGTKSDYINVIIGLFFDGTSNNRSNVNARNKQTDAYLEKTDWLSSNDGSNASYENDHTNVDKLEKIYPKIENKYFSIYIEGIGTEDDKGDFTYGQGFGTGRTGIPAKVRIACERAANKLLKYAEGSGEKINEISIDLFGFSRGAAAARYCAHELTKPETNEKLYFAAKGDKQFYFSPNDKKPVYLVNPPKSYFTDPGKPMTTKSPARGFFGQYMEANRIKYLSFKLRFGGLYDSVSAYGRDHTNDVEELFQNSIDRMAHVVHLTAADEHRKKFELTHVSKGIELSFPGVHSDIGGGYVDNAVEKDVSLAEEMSSVLRRTEIINKERNRLIEQGWYKAGQMKNYDPYKLTGTRTLSNKYSLVSLHIMKDFCVLKCNIPFIQRTLKDEFSIPSPAADPLLDLNKVYNRLKYYAFENNKAPMIFYTNKEFIRFKELLASKQMSADDFNRKANDHNMLLQLRNRYLHWSASWDGIGMEPRINKQGNRERFIFNLPQKK
ncbi:hypothetical protein HDF26_000513 [Pedobacter cryoconitis]|uniref:T6SS phospholipase effector Tle1-like catalytic domain-containing protein n=1 Tax=Pedobacter cryoconitis TaxID=188932 RepID=UPI00161F390D|nr:DUF2235 domain-containing protein [Pedobacter cryoconitis]MBB6270086.1 hypothetical protein [Pedobacter cryoconitis]